MIPKRWQRSRVKGAKQPPNTRYCGRGTIFENSFRIGDPDPLTKRPMTREDVLKRFRGILQSLISLNGQAWFINYYLKPLAGHDYLSCFCSLDVDCHVDIWIDYLLKFDMVNE